MLHETELLLLFHLYQSVDQLHRLGDHLQCFDVEGREEEGQGGGLGVLFISLIEDFADVVADEDAVEVGLDGWVAVGAEVGVVEQFAVFAATARFLAVVGVFLEEGGEVELIFFFCKLDVAVPVEDSEDGDFVLISDFLVDYRALHDIVAIHQEEVAQEHRKGTDKDKHVVLDNRVRQKLNAQVAEVRRNVYRQQQPLHPSQTLLEVHERPQIDSPLPDNHPHAQHHYNQEGCGVNQSC